MSKVEAIAKREDVSPQEGKSKYGDVTYADEKNKKYPLDNESHVRAAWSYINMPKNAAKYSSEDVATIKRKIKAAGKKYGIEFSDGDKSESAYEVTAAYTATFDGTAPSQIVYMPRGTWNITPKVNGAPKEISVSVDEDTFTALQASFEERLTNPPRPFGGFDHKTGKASFIPKGFLWSDEKGIILNVDWTKAGREAIEGRDYSYFSPTFLLSEGKVVGLTQRGEVGSLTNSPAFEQIDRIAASQEPDAAHYSYMPKLTTRLVELDLITAEQATDEEGMIAAIEAMHAELTSVTAVNAGLAEENRLLKAEAERVKGNEADMVIAAAVAEGKIPANDKETIAFYREELIKNPTGMKHVIKAMQPNPVLKPIVQVKTSDAAHQATSAKDKVRVIAEQKAIVNEILAANPGLTWADAWAKAKREHKEAFVEA